MRIKFFFFTIALFLRFTVTAQAQYADTILQHALAQASAEKKNVFLIFHASWCGWCKRMDDAMNDFSCKKLFTRHYVITHLDVDEQDNKKEIENAGADLLKKKYGGDEQGLPYWIILDAKGNLLADSKMPVTKEKTDAAEENVGCPAKKEEVDYFIGTLKQTSTLNKIQLGIIAKRFRQNEIK